MERRPYVGELRTAMRWATEPWAIRHNSAIIAWASDRTTVMQAERMVLDELVVYAQILEMQGGDSFVREHVIIPMGIALTDLLNVDLGRLDGGTLSGFLGMLVDRYDLEELR